MIFNKFMFILNKIVIICILLFLLINLRILSFGLEINADTVEYSDKNGINLLAKNNVIIKLKNKKIYADSINFSTKEKNVTAQGNIKIEEPKKKSFYFDSASYNYDDKNVRINDFFWHYSSIFVHAKFVNGNINLDDTDSNVYDVDNIIFSNCDLDNPHVYFKAKKGRIIPNKMIKVHDVFLYINGIPVFYFPVFIKFLNENHFFNKFKIKPMLFYDGNKLSLMTMFSYDINKFLTGKIIFDLFGRMRNCLLENTDGLFCIGNDVNNEKFEMYFDYFKVINDFLNMRSKMEICFNNDDNLNNCNAGYFADPYISLISENKDVNLNILFNFIQQNHDINLIYNINNVSDFITNFEKMFLIVPSMNFTYYPKNIFAGIIHKFDFNASFRNCDDDFLYNENDSILHSNKQIKHYNDIVHFNYFLMKSFTFLKKITLKPTIKIFGGINNKAKYDMDNIFVNIGYAGYLNLRFRATNWMDFNLNYCLKNTEKNNENNFCIDNYGSNEFLLENYIYIKNIIIIKNSFLHYRTKKAQFITEMTWTPRENIIICCKLLNNKLTNVDYINFYFKIGDLDKLYLNFNSIYNENNISSELGFGLWITSKLKLDYNVIFTTNESNLLRYEINGIEFKIHKNLHCYNFNLLFKIIKDDFKNFIPKIFFDLDTDVIGSIFNKKKNKNINYFEYFNII